MTKLDIYLRLSQHRRIGNTLFNTMGVNYDRPAILLFATYADARIAYDNAVQYIELNGGTIPPKLMRRADLILGKVMFKTISLLKEQHYGELMGVPISIDHFALGIIIDEDREARFKEWNNARAKEV